MINILTHTPTFVFILFFVLLCLGYLQTRDRKIKAFLAYFLPCIMVSLSLIGVISSFGITAIVLCLWLGGLLSVASLRYLVFPTKGIVYLHEERKFFIPGNWVSFAVIMAIFFTKYTLGVMLAMQIPLAHAAGFVLVMSFIYGAFSGYFAGRAALIITAYKHSLTLTR